MAIAVGEIQLTLTARIPIGSGRAIYFGTATGGTEYPTGGATLGEEPTNSRYKLPEKLDFFRCDALGLISAFVAPNKVKLFAETTVATSTETPLSELKSKATMATAVAGVPFMAIGDQ